VKKRCYSN